MTLELTDDETKVLENYLGRANYYEQGAILCKAYETQEQIDAGTSHLLRIYTKLVGTT